MASLLTEMPNVLDVREVMFTNLLLLGFDPAASEEKFKIHFSRYLHGNTAISFVLDLLSRSRTW